MHAYLRLSTNLTERTRDRCPDVVFLLDGDEVATIRTDEQRPRLPIDDGSLDSLVLYDDGLSRAIDEECWLQEFARVLAPGGSLRLTLPAAGMLAWLDTMNAYRYLVDVIGRGDAPDAANPTGWNRHYSRNHINRLMEDAGFEVPDIHAQNYAISEIQLLTGLIRDNWIGQDRRAELKLFPRFGGRSPGKRSFLTTTWEVTTTKR